MPRIDELPIPAQNEIRAHGERFDSQPVKHLVTGRGVGGRDGEAPEPKPKPLLTEAKRPGMPGTEPRTSEPDSGNSRLLATEGLEMQGGSRPLAEEEGDDELDIPNFLRRQPAKLAKLSAARRGCAAG